MAEALPVHQTIRPVDGPPLSERRVALVTTAGLHRATDDAFSLRLDINMATYFQFI